jgi:hypothetical protein
MSAARRDAFSRPVFDQTIRIQSNHAQRLLDRGFLLVVRAPYGIDVVLRIIGGGSVRHRQYDAERIRCRPKKRRAFRR